MLKLYKMLFLLVIIVFNVTNSSAQYKPLKPDTLNLLFKDKFDSTTRYEGQIITNFRRIKKEDKYIINEENNDSDVVPITISNSCFFLGTVFIAKTDFSQVRFNENVQFMWSYFDKPANFSISKFEKSADFPGAIFNNNVTFWIDSFNGYVSFSGAEIKKSFYCTWSVFKKPAYFSNLKISDSAKLDFHGTILPDTIDFSHISNLPCEIDLLQCNLSDSSRINAISGIYKVHYINLYKSDIAKFHLDYTHFKLVLTDIKNTDRKSLNKIENIPVDEAKTVYSALLKNFKDRGQDDSYELLDIEYQNYKWNHNKYFFWFGWFLHHWNNYGHRPELPLLWTVCLIVIFTYITFFCLPFLHNNVYSINAISSLNLSKLPNPKQIAAILSYKSFFKRLWYSFIYTSLIFFPLSLRVDKIKVDKKLGTLYVMVMYIIGLICVGYVANFVLQK